VETLYRRLENGMKELPGVQGIAVSNVLPLAAERLRTASRFSVPGSPAMRPDAYPLAEIRTASPSLFRVLGVPLRAGRFFADQDAPQPYVIINESMARAFWPGRSAVGERFITGLWGPAPTWSTVIGVVGDVKQFGLDSESSYEMYFQSDYPTYVFVRTGVDPNSLASAVRRVIRRIDPNIPVTDVRSMDEVLDQSTTQRRFLTSALAGFAAVALALAVVGIYGLLSFWVTQNRREIGIRMALGADSASVLGAVLGRALRLAAIGLVIGIAASLASGRVLAGLLFQVGAHDPAVMLSVGILMLAVTAAACLTPALRATRIDPVRALRSQ
jgi:predicted permease